MAFPTDPPTLASLDEPSLGEYRRVSLSAIAALSLGLLSVLALAHPLLVAVPVAACCVAIYALRQIAAPQANLIGRNIAIVGLLLGIFFGAWSPAQSITRQRRLQHQSRVFADQWLELIRDGRLQEAHQLTERAAYRQPADVALDRFYTQNTEAASSLNTFSTAKLLKNLIALGKQATYRYAGNVGTEPMGTNRIALIVQYEAEYEQDGKRRSQTIHLALEREPSPDDPHEYQWRVRSVFEPNEQPQ